MSQRNWILRIKGKHMVTILASGEVRYSVGKVKLFTLKKDALKEIESLIKLSISEADDSIHTNLIRYNTDKGVMTLFNCKLYTMIWKMIYEASNVKDTPEEVLELTDLVDYIIHFGDPASEVTLDAPDPEYLIRMLDVDIVIESLINLILTKNNKVYYLN